MLFSRFHKRIEFFVDHATAHSKLLTDTTVLFVGCGRGEEALCFQNMYPRVHVVGLDIKVPVRNKFARTFDFVLANASDLPFRSSALDFCYCYHVLEHVRDERRSLSEIARVLTRDGELYLSTPNKRRIILYIQSAQEVKLFSIIRGNLREWYARLTLRFSREKGYHTGFSQIELSSMLSASFEEVRFVTVPYTFYMTNGTLYSPFVKLLYWARALRAVAPSLTAYCRRPRRINVDTSLECASVRHMLRVHSEESAPSPKCSQ